MILNTIKEEAISGLRKAAMLLVVLGEQSSAELLQQLSEDDVQKVSREVARVTSISSEQAENILSQCLNPRQPHDPIGFFDSQRLSLGLAMPLRPLRNDKSPDLLV